MNPRRLFVASCVALVTAGVAFSVRTDIIPAWKMDFGFTDTEIGQAAGAGLWGVAITMVLGSMVLDRLGMGKLVTFAFFTHLLGILLTLLARDFWTFYFATLLIGLAHGTIEAVINPLIASLYPEDKTRCLNILHAWWPGGLIIGGLLAFAVTKIMGLDTAGIAEGTLSLGWKIKMCFALVPTLLYGFLMFGQKFPKTERVTAGVSYAEMIREVFRPGLLLMTVIMMITAATEVGPDQWVGNLLHNLMGMQGVLILVYTAGIMFVLRQFFTGPLVAIFNPIGVLTLSAILSGIGLLWLSYAGSALMVLVASTVFGIGKSYFWPTMLGVTADRFPKGGAVALGVLSGAGMLSVGFLMTPAMGFLQDHYAVARLSEISPSVVQKVVRKDAEALDEKKVIRLSEEGEKKAVMEAKAYSAVMTFRWVALLPAILTVIFVLLLFQVRLQGGYRIVKIE